MREIKFKFYDKKTHRLVEECDMWWNYIERFDPDEVFVCEFTGLVDKNGKEIYEGDIYTVNFNWNNKEIIKKSGKIIYNHDGFKIQFPDKSNPRRLGTNSNKLNGEVIGNKYENPDLLTHKPI